MPRVQGAALRRLNNWSDAEEQNYQARHAANRLFVEPLETVRDGRVLGDTVRVADFSVTPIDIYEATIERFDVGKRVIVSDRQGFLHFTEPLHAVVDGAAFTFQHRPALKYSAGWRREKNLAA